MSNVFADDDYKPRSTGGNYLKFELGETKFRILSDPIRGYSGWVDTDDGKRKPVRSKEEFTDISQFDEPPRPFRAMVVWNYGVEAIQVFETDKATIIKPIIDLAKDEDYGDPKGYDIKVTKTGKGKETRYAVKPLPPKAVSKEIKKAFIETPVNLSALYSNGDPFKEEALGAEEIEI